MPLRVEKVQEALPAVVMVDYEDGKVGGGREFGGKGEIWREIGGRGKGVWEVIGGRGGRGFGE